MYSFIEYIAPAVYILSVAYVRPLTVHAVYWLGRGGKVYIQLMNSINSVLIDHAAHSH